MKKRLGRILPLLLAAVMAAALFGVPAAAESTVASYPSVFHMKISGTPVVGGTLTVSYELYDPDGTQTGLDSKLQWQQQNAPYYIRADNLDGKAEKTLQTGGRSFTIPAEAAGQYIAVNVPVSSVTGNARMRTVGVGPVVAAGALPDTPQAQAVTVQNASAAAGTAVGEPVEGNYLYAGKNAEGASRFAWSLSDTEQGTYTPISGAAGKTYIPKVEDMGKYLRFTVIPVDSSGAEGVETHSLNLPIVGDAAYGAQVSGEGGCYKGCAVNSITNGIETNDGGAVFTYNLSTNPNNTRDLVVDLGETRVLDGARIIGKGNDASDGATLFASVTGVKDSFQPVFTAAHNGTDTEEQILYVDGGDVAFKAPVRARFIQARITLNSNSYFRELVLKEALPDAIAAEKKASVAEALSVAQGMTAAEVKAALADKIGLKGTYGTDTYDLPADQADYALDTSTAGEKDLTLTYKGKTAVIPVEVDAAVTLESLRAVKAALYTKDLEVPVHADAQEVRLALCDALEVTGHYSDGSEAAIAAADAAYTLDTTAAGTKSCTVAYGGKEAAVDVNVVEAKQMPEVYGLYIEGAPVAGETLTFHYTLEDPDAAVADMAQCVSWHRLDKPYGVSYSAAGDKYNTERLLADKTLTYTIPSDGSLDGQYIHAAVDLPDEVGWGKNATVAVGPVKPAKTSAPEASTVTVSSVAKNGGRGVGANIGQTLRGEYYYIGEKAESGSTYQWYSSSANENSGFVPIDGATAREYTIQEADRGKYLKFTVTPKDESGAAGAETESLSRPIAGNAAFLAMARDSIFGQANGTCYEGTSLSVLTNGILTEANGGAVMTYAGTNGKPYGTETIDLGAARTITAVRMQVGGNNANTVQLFTSLDGHIWYPVETNESGKEIPFPSFTPAAGGRVTFKTPVQARYLSARFLRSGNVRVRDIEAEVSEAAPALQSISAEKKQGAADLSIAQNATAAQVRAYLMENVTVKAAYAGEAAVEVLPAAAEYSLDTSAAGTVDAQVSFLGKAASVAVKVEAPELTGISVEKAPGVSGISVWQNADAQALKSLIKDKIVITGAYSDGSSAVISGEDASYSADTSAAGTVDVTVTYGGKTALVSVTVTAVSLSKIEVVKAPGVDAITVWKDSDAAGIKAALADKIVITGTYSDGSTQQIANADAAYSGDTSNIGAADVTVTYGGKTALVSVTVAAVALSKIDVEKAPGVSEIKVPKGADAAGIKTALADKIVITGTYSDGSTQRIANTDANYSGDTSAEGAAEITVTYGGKAAAVSVTVELVITLTGISAEIKPGVGGLKVSPGTDADGLKTYLKDRIVITGTYSDGSSAAVPAADAAYSGNTSAEGSADITITYQQKTAILPVRVSAADIQPNLYGLYVEGTPVAGETLTFHYTLEDPDGSVSDLAQLVSWHRIDKPYIAYKADYFSTRQLAEKTLTFTIPNDGSLDGQYIQAAVALPNQPGYPKNATIAVGPVEAAKTSGPAVRTVTVSSTGGNGARGVGADVGQTLRGEYYYIGEKAESGSTYQWYRCDSEYGTYTAIEGAAAREYTVQKADRGKYLKFTVTPKDTAGGAGTPADSISRPVGGNAAYLAYVHDTVKDASGGTSYPGTNLNVLTNGISDTAGGGEVMTYGGASDGGPHGLSTVDLGETQTLGAVWVSADGTSQNSVCLFASVDGTTWTPLKNKEGVTELPMNDLKPSGGGKLELADAVQARYIRMEYTRFGNVHLRELRCDTQDIGSVLTGISVAKIPGVSELMVPQGADAAALKAALADKIVITASYADGSAEAISGAEAEFSGNTAAAGAADITVTYGGKTAVIAVTVKEQAALTGISVAKAPGVTSLEVEQNADAAALKAALKDKIVITAAYSDGTTGTVPGSAAEYSGDTTRPGETNIIVAYQGKTAAVAVKVNERTTPANVDPSLFGMRITGTPVAGETLTFSYELYDPMGKEPNVESKVDWQLQAAPDYVRKDAQNTEQSLQKGTLTYTIPNDASVIGKYISVNVQMTGITGNGRCRTMGVGPILAAKTEAPGASSVTIIQAPDSAKAGSDSAQVLMGDYLYTGAQEEAGSTYQWYLAENENGPFTAIEGAVQRTYTPKNSDRKKYLQFRVTPVDVSGAAGAEASSANKPQVGNAAYRAYVGGNGSCYAGCALNSITNGIAPQEGGAVFTYGAGAPTDLVVDLGTVRKLDSASILGSGKDGDGVTLFISATGEEGTYSPILTADHQEGDTEDFIPYGEAEKISFREAVSGRFVKINFTHIGNVTLREAALFTAPDEEPVITLTGGPQLRLLRGETFAEPGYSAMDHEDGDLTARVMVTGRVDTSTVGTYELTYSVTDSKPQTVAAVRQVLVADGYQAEGDLAYQRPVTADGANPAALVDGNKFTDWQAGTAASSAVIDLGQEEWLSNAVILENGNAVSGFAIEVSSDGGTWKTAYTGTSVGAERNVDFDPVSGRYVRLRITGASQPPEIATLEIRFDALGKVKRAVEALEIPTDLNAVTKDLPLLEKGLYETKITWKSGNSAVITDKGIVTRGQTNQTVELTATVALSDVSLEKTFSAQVLKKTSNNSGPGGGGGGGGTGGSSVQVPVVQPPAELPAPPENPVVSGQFKDVPDTYWAKQYIESLAAKGIVNGKENGSFDAEGTVTRAEFLKMVVQVFGLKAENPAAAFSDVTSEDWYYAAVTTAAALGVTGGMGDGTFGADLPVTRQDMAVMTARAAQIAEKSLGEPGKLDQYTDAADVSSYAGEALGILSGAGIISGDDSGALLPQENATRAQAAKILCMVLERTEQ